MRLAFVSDIHGNLAAYDDDQPYPLSNFHRIENGSPDARYAVVENWLGTGVVS